MNAQSVNLINNDKPVVVCCGDSITHGHIGYDWVSSLRNSDHSKIYINAGINADLTWNLNQIGSWTVIALLYLAHLL